MRYDTLAKVFRKTGVFTLADVCGKLNGRALPDRKNLPRTLNRWVKAGKLQNLRRGVYLLPKEQRARVTVERIANKLYGPGYVTGIWALSKYGLIPEGAVEVTSATTKNPAYFETPIGRFRYQHIAPHLVFGVGKQKDPDGSVVLIADREKTLLDFLWWHLNDNHRPGFTWDKNEFERWRFQDTTGEVIEQKLFAYAGRFGDSRMQVAAQRLADHLRTTRMNFVVLPPSTSTQALLQRRAFIGNATEPRHRSILAPQIHAQVAQIKAKEQRDKAEILAMKVISPFASSYLRKIEAREEVELLASLGLKADETVVRSR
jgi:hypothetical protein